MAMFVHDCPHCGAMKISFMLYAHHPNAARPGMFDLAGACAACGRTVVLTAVSTGGRSLNQVVQTAGDLLQAGVLQMRFVEPGPKPIEAPADVPPPVARAFKEGAGSRRDGRWSAACAMYRRAMELGLKAFGEEIDAWKLEKRIDKLFAANLITKELKEWAHAIRLDGNAAIHGEEEADEPLADQMHNLCWFLLLYLYSLPAQVARAKPPAENAEA